jgi:hypothetical protein
MDRGADMATTPTSNRPLLRTAFGCVIGAVIAFLIGIAWTTPSTAETKSASGSDERRPPVSVRDACLRDSRMFCIDFNGTAIPGEIDPRVGPHDSLTIVVVGKSAEHDNVLGKTLRLEAATGSLPSWHYFPMQDAGTPMLREAGTVASPPATDAGSADDGTSDAGAPEVSASSKGDDEEAPLEKLLDLHINDIPDIASLTITYRMMQGRELGTGVLVERPLNFAIGKNGYYLEPTLVFPTIFGGDRTIGTRAQANGQLSTLHAHVGDLGALENVSIGFNIYPFGYPGTKCPYGNSTWSNLIPFVCHPKLVLRPITLQAGTSITRNAFKEYFFGAGYTIVRGVAVTGGVAFVRGDFFGPTIFEGQTVPANYQVSDAVIERKLMMRPYFAVSINADVLQIGVDFLNLTRNIGHPTIEPEP